MKILDDSCGQYPELDGLAFNLHVNLTSTILCLSRYGPCCKRSGKSLGNAGASLAWFAQGLAYRQPMPCGLTLSPQASCLCSVAGKLLAGVGTSLLCQRRNYSDFERIGWDFNWGVGSFLRIRWENADFLSFFDGGARVIR